MHRLRTRLIAVFLLATLAPLALTVWLVRSLIDRSFDLTNTRELDQVSRSLELTGREIYRRARLNLKSRTTSDRTVKAPFPADLEGFGLSSEPERFELIGPLGDRLRYLVRQGVAIAVYEESLAPVGLTQLAKQYADA